MKRKPLKRTNPPIEEDGGRLPPPLPPRGAAFFEAPDDDPGEQALEELRQQFGTGDCQLKVFKIGEDGTEFYCHTFTSPRELNEESIKKLKRGGGKYSVKAIINGVFRYVIPFAILDDIQPHQNGNGHSSMADPVLTMLQKQNEMLLTILTKRPEVAGEREPVSQLVDAVAKMQQLNKPPEMSVETILKCIEIGKSLAPGGSDDSLMGMVKEVVKGAAPAIAGMMANRGAVPAEQPPMRTVSGVPSVVEGQNVNVIESAMMRAGLDFLKKKAIANSDPELYVHLIADNADDPKYQKLVARIVNEEFSFFVSLDPEIGKEPFAKFFRHVYDRLRSIFSGSDSLDDNSGGESGNNGNAPGDAAASS